MCKKMKFSIKDFFIFIKEFLIDLETSHLKKSSEVDSLQKIWQL